MPGTVKTNRFEKSDIDKLKQESVSYFDVADLPIREVRRRIKKIMGTESFRITYSEPIIHELVTK